MPYRAVSRRQLGIGLGQVGAFSIVLGSLGVGHGVLTTTVFTAILTTVVITVAASSTLVSLGDLRVQLIRAAVSDDAAPISGWSP